jgi:biotin synthase
VRPAPPLTVAEVEERAARAKSLGATRFCAGAAWRGPHDGAQFERVLEMPRAVRRQGMVACVTLGLLTDGQAGRPRDAGLSAYSHTRAAFSSRSYGQKVSVQSVF